VPSSAPKGHSLGRAGQARPEGPERSSTQPAQPSSVPSVPDRWQSTGRSPQRLRDRQPGAKSLRDALGRSVRSSAWPLTPDGDPSCLPAVSTLFCPVPAEGEARFRRALRRRHRKGVVRPEGFLPLRKRNGQKVSASLCQPKNFSGAVARSLHR
jgi:hypothetical protein